MERGLAYDNCPDCDLCEVLADGSLFCALLEEQVHGDQRCMHWIKDSNLFIKTAKGFRVGKEKDCK